MTANEYAEIARVASAWLLDRDISPHRRRIAEYLYDLASQLTDPDYGCPSEFNAVTVMFQYLQQQYQACTTPLPGLVINSAPSGME